MKPSRIQRLERQALKAIVALYRADLAYRTACRIRIGSRAGETKLASAWRRRVGRFDAVIAAGRALDDARADKRRKERSR